MDLAFHPVDKYGNFVRTLKPIKLRGFTIPKGFESDGASVPPILYTLVFPPTDPAVARAAIAHDYVYREHPEGWTKEQADKMFYDMLLEDGCSPFKAKLAYNGVSLFGGPAWHAYDTKENSR